MASAASKTTSSTDILANLSAEIKDKLLNGQRIRVIDYLEEERGFVLAAIAILRDELPICSGWLTVRESHASETRTRARTYSIPGEFLREVGHE